MQQPPDLAALRLTQRFHVQLTVLYAAAVLLLVVLPMGFGYYHFGAQSEMVGLQQRLLVTAAALAAPIEGEVVAAFDDPMDVREPDYKRIARHIEAATRVDPSIYSVYILLRTEDPGVMRYAMDVESKRAMADDSDLPNPTVGQRYEVARFPRLIDGLDGPSVESALTFDDWVWTMSGYAPIRDREGRAVGVLGVDVDGQRVAEMRRRVWTLTLAISGLGIALFVLGGMLVGRSIRRPLEQLIEATGKVSRGDLEVTLGMQRRDEFGVVGGHFDAMVEGLREREYIRATFGRYVSEEVAQALLSDPTSTHLGGEVRHVTVLFSDLRGYSTISEQLEPAEIVDLLNHYFGAMQKVLDRHGGVVIELFGDAILAVFGAPQRLDGHAAHAVRCALEMRERLHELNIEWEASGLAERWTKVGLDALAQRIGIHTGDVVAGNLGSLERTKYAIIGDTVNLASRLEQMNKLLDTAGILLSEETRSELPEDLASQCRARGDRVVKGRESAVRVYSL